jgi:hypothetical protein
MLLTCCLPVPKVTYGWTARGFRHDSTIQILRAAARPINKSSRGLDSRSNGGQLHHDLYHHRKTWSNTMADTDPRFHVRSASPDGDDAEFILAAWDSTLPFLASIGAGEMWGDQLFSQRAGQKQEVIDLIKGTSKELDGGRQFWIAEVHGAVY